MSRYTYTLNPGMKKTEEKHYYKIKQLQQMTTFQLQEICHKERLVIPSEIYRNMSGNKALPYDSALIREGLTRLIMRFRGQKDYSHITEYCNGGMERLQQILDKIPLTMIQDGGIHIPASITLYEGMVTDELDGIVAESEGVTLYEGNLLLVDETFHIHTCLYLKKSGETYYICKGENVPALPDEKHQYAILYFPSEQASECLYEKYHDIESRLPVSLSCIRIPLLELTIIAPEETQMPLVIDFGSCNITMGICLPDGTRKIAVLRNEQVLQYQEFIPSIIGITGINENEPEYIFGHVAASLCRNNYQDQDVPVFYDIKRWISDPDRNESIILHNGIKVILNRRAMLKAFIEYLIKDAEKQFKCRFKNIQILAPIRQKEKFRKLFENMVSGISIDCSLDEGMAVLFSSISTLINSGSYQSSRWYKALILDCGGGTTDLTSGRFRIHSGRISYDIDLESSYEDGDTNFGGNNLTYQILKLIKIKICQELSGKEKWEDHNIDEAYQMAEKYLPTAFKEYADIGRADYFYVKNNYYYLFELAEQVKKSFFKSEVQYELWLSTDESKIVEKESRMTLDRWKLFVVKNGRMTHLDKGLYFPLYLHQIEAILRPDIYQLMKRFLEPKFRNNELKDYQMIKLTGQSCKSRLFEEALKEYMPGVLIQRSEQEQERNELKMCCLEGALSYFYGRKLGYMNINQKYQVGALPYEIMAYTHEGKKQMLVRCMDKEGHIGYISRFMVGKQLDIHLSDTTGKLLKTYYYECSRNDFEKTTQEEIDQKYTGTVIQEETDTIQEGEMKFFVWVSRNRWGFIILPVLREKEQIYKGKETFFDFEDDTWEENFFDGRK